MPPDNQPPEDPDDHDKQNTQVDQDQDASGEDTLTDEEKKYRLRRPSGFRQKTKNDVWNNAEDGSQEGTKQCPTCGKDVSKVDENGVQGYDIDHQPAWKHRQDAMGKESELPSRKDVLDEYNSGVRLECRSCNRGRGARPLK